LQEDLLGWYADDYHKEKKVLMQEKPALETIKKMV
jgi:hypothetical protein